MKNLYYVSIVIALILNIHIVPLHAASQFQKKLQKKRQPFALDRLKNKENIIPVAVIGGGPGGLSTAFYAAREGYPTALFSGKTLGGQLMDTEYVENWPGIKQSMGHDVVKTIEGQASSVGALLIPESVISVDLSSWPYLITTDAHKNIYALSIIIASGAQPRKLHVPGEEEYYGKGVASCTLCDAPFTRGDDVVIVGGGDSSLEFTFALLPFAQSITVLVRKDSLDASPKLISRLASYPDINFMYNVAVQEIKGNQDHVTEVIIRNQRTKKNRTIKTRWLFLSIGQDPNTAMLNNQLPCNKNGCIILPNKSQETSIRGVFCAGRVSNSPYKTGIVASGEGIKAALDAGTFLDTIGYHEKIESLIKPHLFTIENESKDASRVHIQSVVNKSELQKIIDAHPNKKIMLKLYSPQCSHCQAMKPIIEAFAQKNTDIIVVQNNINKSDTLSQEYKIASIPTCILFQGGKEKKRLVGKKTADELEVFAKGS